MGKEFRAFFAVCSILIIILLAALVIFVFAYKYFSLHTYNILLLFFITLIIILITSVIAAFSAIMIVYSGEKVGMFVLKYAKVSLWMLTPIVAMLTGISHVNRDRIRNFFIQLNNIIVSGNSRKYRPEDITILLPHCLQYSNCNVKVTSGIENCRRCGKCRIGSLAVLGEKYNVKIYVVTGGTAARNIVFKDNPKALLSVACERDLASGIMDTRRIPVIGILNERPNGPCIDTIVDVAKVEEEIRKLLN